MIVYRADMIPAPGYNVTMYLITFGSEEANEWEIFPQIIMPYT